MGRLFTTILIIALSLVAAGVASAEMRQVGDELLESVVGRAGISIDMDLGLSFAMDSYRFSDSSADPNWLELKGISLHNGLGGGYLIKTSDDTGVIPSTMDVTTDPSGRTLLTLTDSSRISPRYYSVDKVIFSGQELGALHIGPVVDGPSTLRMSAPPVATGADGILFDYVTRLDIGSFAFAYNSTSSLALNGVHFFGAATGAPELDPAGWGMSGKFRVGSIDPADLNPATFAVVTEPDGRSSTALNLPMQGSVRVEDLAFGPSSFGPAALDGINVHRLQLRFTP